MQAKTCGISAKCSDCCFIQLKDEEGLVIAEHEGYVPDFIPGPNRDCLLLVIDLETGRILNWKSPTEEDLKKLIQNDENYDR